MTVFLFDIDGTLIKTGGAGGLALLNAFSDIFGVPDPAEVPFSGRTDRGIAQSLFRLHGIEDTDDHFHQLRGEYLKRLNRYLAQCDGEVLPGVVELLEQLVEQPTVAVGLLTGNTREGAQLKLEHYGLWHYFSFGGFGDAHVDRNGVAHEALAACRDQAGNQWNGRPVWVIGDTPLDISCARTIGAKVVAVATGWHDRKRLAEAQPDLLLDDLRHTELIVQQTLADPV